MKKTATKELLLFLLKAGGFVALSILAPQLPYLLLKSYFKEGNLDRRKFKKFLSYLESQKMITTAEENGQVTIRITEKGKIKALKYEVETMEIKKPKKWDGKWRIVIFDIPKDKKMARDFLRWKLNDLGFIMLQKSVFIHPYPCTPEITFIKEFFEVTPYVKLLIADQIEDEVIIKKKFGL